MSPLILTTKNADACKRILLGGRIPPLLDSFEGLTLPGLMELGLHAVCAPENEGYGAQIQQSAIEQDRIWGPFLREWRTQGRDGFGPDIYGVRRIEFFRLRNEDDLLGDHFRLFQQRFDRSIKGNGFPNEFAIGLTKTLFEMADNIIQHSHAQGEESTGIIGYHTEAHYMVFTVADWGRGVLRSLTTNAEWKHIATSMQALTAVVRQGASSRPGHGEGEGFRQLFRSLIDRNSLIRFRSFDAALEMADVNDRREGTASRVPSAPGTQISVCSCLRGPVAERQITFD